MPNSEIAPTARAMTGSQNLFSLSLCSSLVKRRKKKREKNKLWQLEATPSGTPLYQPTTYQKFMIIFSLPQIADRDCFSHTSNVDSPGAPRGRRTAAAAGDDGRRWVRFERKGGGRGICSGCSSGGIALSSGGVVVVFKWCKPRDCKSMMQSESRWHCGIQASRVAHAHSVAFKGYT